MKRLYLTSFAMAMVGGVFSPAVAIESEYRLAVATPANDYHPAISPDGKWMVYVSDRNGAPGLYRRNLSSKAGESDRAIFPFPARSESPVFSPKGKFLSFASQREDALGDIWYASFPKGSLQLISSTGRLDQDPFFSSDSSCIYYKSGRVNEPKEFVRYILPTRVTETVTEDSYPLNAFLPAFPYPVQDVDLNGGAAILYADDTNADGVLDSSDQASVWEVVDGKWYPVTGVLPASRGIAKNISNKEIYIGLKEADRFHLVQFSGTILRDNNYQELMVLARQNDDAQVPDGNRTISLYRSAWLKADPREEKEQAALLYIHSLLRMERGDQAVKELEALVSQLGENKELSAYRLIAEMIRVQNTPKAEEFVRAETELKKQLEMLVSAEAFNTIGKIHLLQARLYRHQKKTFKAFEETGFILNELRDSVSEQVIVEAELIRALLYRDAGLVAESEKAFMAVFGGEASSVSLYEQAAQGLMDSARANKATDDEKLFALRNLAVQADQSPWLRARVRLEEGRFLEELQEFSEAEVAYRQSSDELWDAPGPALEAVTALARLAALQDDYPEALRLLVSMQDQFNQHAQDTILTGSMGDIYEEVNRLVVRHYLEKGRRELALGDPALAQSTFKSVLELNPGLYGAWRGRIAALSQREDWLDEAITEYKGELGENKEDPLFLYKYALAQSYVKVQSSRVEKDLRKSISKNSSYPHPFVALGYMMEERYKDRKARGWYDNETLLEALALYEEAYNLVDRELEPGLYADILLNLANTSRQLGLEARSVSYYKLREEAGLPFTDPRREFLFHWNMGLVLYQTSNPKEAATHFAITSKRASDLIVYLSEEEVNNLEINAIGHEALAYLDAGEYAKSLELFKELYDKTPENDPARVRIQRNQAFLLYLQGKEDLGEAQNDYLSQARSMAQSALAQLKGLEDPAAYNENKAQKGFTFSFSMDSVTGGSLIDVDAVEEERLLHGLLSGISQLQGRFASEESELGSLLSLMKESTKTSPVYQRAEKTVILSRLAFNAYQRGEVEKSLEQLYQGLELCYLNEAEVEIVNTNAATRLMVQLAETALRSPKESLELSEASLWMISDVWKEELPSGFWNQLGMAAQELLDRRPPEADENTLPLIFLPEERARLIYVKALAEEQRIYSLIDSSGDGVQLLQNFALLAEKASDIQYLHGEIVSQATIATMSLEELYKLTVLSSAVILRVEAQLANPKVEKLFEKYRKDAREKGFGNWEWWLKANMAMGASDGVQAVIWAKEARQTILSQGFLLADAKELMAEETFRALEIVEIEESYKPDKETQSDVRSINLGEESWEIHDGWRVARLRWMGEQLQPSTRGEESQQWRADYQRLKEDWLEKQLALRELAVVFAPQRETLLGQLAGTKSALDRLVEKGWDEAIPYAISVYPQAKVYDDMDGLQGLYTTGAFPVVLYGFMKGAWGSPESPKPDSVEKYTEYTIHTLSTHSMLSQSQRLDLRLNRVNVVYPSEDLNQLALTYSLEISEPVIAQGAQPGNWEIQSTDLTLGELLSKCQDPKEVTLTLEGPEQNVLALAFWLECQGVSQAVINDERWIGVPVSAERFPELIKAELSVTLGKYQAAMDEGDTVQAALHLERAIAIKMALKDEVDLALAWNALTRLQMKLGDYTSAKVTAGRWIEMLQSTGANQEELADAQKVLGSISSSTRENEAMDAAYQEAIALYKVLDQQENLFQANRDYAIALENNGRFVEALEQIKAARSVVPASDAEADLRLILQSARIMNIYLNRYPEAEDLLASLEDKARRNNNKFYQFQAWINLARVYQSTARFVMAMQAIDEAEVFANALDDKSLIGEISLEWANLYWFRAEYFESFREQQKALELAEKENDLPLKIATFNVSGLTNWTLNDYPHAYADLNRALKLCEEYDVAAETASTYNNLGLVYRSENQFDRALRYFNLALEIDQKEGNRWGEAYSLRNIGLTYTARRAPGDAMGHLEKAAELSKGIGDQTNYAKSLLALGEAHSATGLYMTAEKDLQEALDLARVIPLPEVTWRCLYQQGVIAQSNNEITAAISFYNESLDVIDNMRASIRIEEFQDGFLYDKQRVYDALITLQIDSGLYVDAFETSEKSRGRNFIDLLGNRKLDLRTVEDQKLLDRENELRLRIEDLERRLGAASEETVGELTAQLEATRSDYSDFLILLRTESPELSSFVRVEPVKASEIQALLDPGTQMIVYHLLDDRIACWVVGLNQLEFLSLDSNSRDIERLVGETRIKLQNYETVNEELGTLADILIKPVLPLTQGASRLGIVPHQSLHNLPFAALRLGPGRHLVDEAALFYVPSTSVLRYTIPRREAGVSNSRVLAVGNPDLGNKALSLPFAQKEAERMTFDFDDVTVKLGAEATESWLVENLPNYGIIHIASHGEFNPDTPLFSAVLLSPDMENDGVLTAEEVFSLRLRADLIALSACQTGLGRVSNGDDIVGLNRAFVYAGTRELLTTLWRVDDISTAVLFKYFYRTVQSQDRAEALRQSQIRLKNRPEYRHPAHWAALVLSGDWK